MRDDWGFGNVEGIDVVGHEGRPEQGGTVSIDNTILTGGLQAPASWLPLAQTLIKMNGRSATEQESSRTTAHAESAGYAKLVRALEDSILVVRC